MPEKMSGRGSRIPVPAERLAVGVRLPFDVFVDEGGAFARACAAGQLFGPAERAGLEDRGVDTVYVEGRDVLELDAYLGRVSEESVSNHEDPVAVREYIERKPLYHQVDRFFLEEGRRVAFGVYRTSDLRLLPVVEPSGGVPGTLPGGLSPARGDFVIRNGDIPLYREYLDLAAADMERRAASPRQKSQIRAFAARERSKMAARELLEDPRSGEKVREGERAVSGLVACILADRDVLYDLVTTAGFDQYACTHAVNVAVLCAGIGLSCGMGEDDLRAIGTGALLHDVGKGAIPPEILHKPGRLNDREFEVMKSHVVEGVRAVESNDAVPQASRVVILEHHERIAGTGYPNGLSGPGISLFGRVCAIADCYDAVTTARPYKDAGTPFQALMLMKVDRDSYDGGILEGFIRMLGQIQSSRMKAAG